MGIGCSVQFVVCLARVTGSSTRSLLWTTCRKEVCLQASITATSHTSVCSTTRDHTEAGNTVQLHAAYIRGGKLGRLGLLVLMARLQSQPSHRPHAPPPHVTVANTSHIRAARQHAYTQTTACPCLPTKPTLSPLPHQDCALHWSPRAYLAPACLSACQSWPSASGNGMGHRLNPWPCGCGKERCGGAGTARGHTDHCVMSW